MKRKLLIVMIIVCVFSVGCGSEDKVAETKSAKPKETTSELEENKDIQLTPKTYLFNENNLNYKITYPQLEENRYEINEKITEFAMKTVKELGYEVPLYNKEYEFYEERTIEENYKIMLQSKDILSVVITGYYNIKGTAHPSHTARTLNIDLNTGKEINISERYNINEEFIDKMLQSAKEQVDIDIYEYIKEMSNENILEYCKTTDTMFLMEDGVGIYYETIYALGGFVEIEIELS